MIITPSKISLVLGLAVLAIATGCAGSSSETTTDNSGNDAPTSATEEKKAETPKTNPKFSATENSNGSDGWFDNIPNK